MKILVCGLPGSGKTWLSERLVKHIDNCAWYNADFVRKYANDWDFELTGRMRQANRMFTAGNKVLIKSDLVTIEPQDILRSRLFKE